VRPDNFRAALRSFTRRRPFQPFVVELVTGERIQVRHPEVLVLGGDVAVYNHPNRAVLLFDGESVCQLCDESALTPPAS
jgi:hypothetical protein